MWGFDLSFFSGAACFGRRGRSDLDINGLDDMEAFFSISAFNSANHSTFLAYPGGKTAFLPRCSLCSWVLGYFSANWAGWDLQGLAFSLLYQSSLSPLLRALSTLLPGPVLFLLDTKCSVLLTASSLLMIECKGQLLRLLE